MKNMLLKSAVLAIAGVGLLAGSVWANPFLQINNGSVIGDNGQVDGGTITYDTTGQVAPSFSFYNLTGQLTNDFSGIDPNALYTVTVEWSGLQYKPNSTSDWLDPTYGNLNLSSGSQTSPMANQVTGTPVSGNWGALTWNLNWANGSGTFQYNFGSTGLFTNQNVSGFLYQVDPDHNGTMTADMRWDHLKIQLNSVPEPATMLLFGTGLLGLVGVTRRKKK